MKTTIDQNKSAHEEFIKEVLKMARERNINVAVVTDLRMGCSSVSSDNYFVEKCYNAMVIVAEREREKKMKSYRELISLTSFEERLKYLSLAGSVGITTFGGHRVFNQTFYRSAEWKRKRREVILRDGGFDLAHPDYPIGSVIYIHHINPITIDDLIEGRPTVFDLDNLVSVSFGTHQAIHYGDGNYKKEWHERTPNDTCPWK